MITKVDTWEEFKRVLDEKGGFLSAHWDGTVETEVAIKEATKATIRCIPVDAVDEEGVASSPAGRRTVACCSPAAIDFRFYRAFLHLLSCGANGTYRSTTHLRRTSVKRKPAPLKSKIV